MKEILNRFQHLSVSLGLLASHAVALLKAALRAEHGEQKVLEEVSSYYLVLEIRQTYQGMMVAIPARCWEVFATMSDGELAGPPYAQPVAPFKVRIADRECEVLYGGAAPGLVAGLVQLNVRVPVDIAPGVVPVTLEVDGLTSPRTVSLAVH